SGVRQIPRRQSCRDRRSARRTVVHYIQTEACLLTDAQRSPTSFENSVFSAGRAVALRLLFRWAAPFFPQPAGRTQTYQTPCLCTTGGRKMASHLPLLC